MKFILCFNLVLISLTTNALTLRGLNSFWQCSANDSNHKSWDFSSSYKKKAINFAYKLCKQKSQQPASCFTSHESCKMIINGQELNNRWKCMAFDHDTGHYNSDHFKTRNDAADGSKLLCKKLSPFPSTCYVRLSTCKNKAI